MNVSRSTTPRKPAAPRPPEECDGVLPVDKPAGPTSHDIVHRIRRTFGFRKVGHGGTLDPLATGLLVVLIGRGTKLSDQFAAGDKTYEGTLVLGVATDTQDAEGTVVTRGETDGIGRNQVAQIMKSMEGDRLQTPPMISAVKVNGVPLYKLARKGKTVRREPKLIHLYAFDLVDFRPPEADFRLSCTKGTYVRTLCAEIGESLGCGAHLGALRRTDSGNLSIDQALSLPEILKMDRTELLRHILPVYRFARSKG